MKRFLGKMFGVLLTVAILMSLVPATVVSAESTGMVKSLSRFRVFLNGDIIGLCEQGSSVFIDLDPDGVGDGDFLATGGAQSITISKGEKGYAEVVFGGNSKPIVLDNPSSYDAILYTGGKGTSNEDLIIFSSISLFEAVERLIDNIPETFTVDDEDLIVAAREAYDRLGDLAAEIDEDHTNKLLRAEETLLELKDKKAAQDVIDAIEALPENITLDNEGDIANARAALDNLTEDQRKLVPADTIDKLEAYEADLAALKAEQEPSEEDLAAAKAAADLIDALPDPGDVTIDDEYAINEALVYYNDLTNAQKALISDELMAKLNSDLIAVYILIIDQYYKLGETLINDYGNVMSEDSKAKLQAAMDNADDVLNSGVISSDTLEEAIYDLVIALLEADEELEGIYTITDDSGAKWAQGSTTGLTFRIVQEGISDDAYDFFEDGGCYIEVDGKVLDISLFTYEKGSVIITIMPEFLKTLSLGEHTITIKFSNATVTTKFTVTPASSVPASGEAVSTAAIAGVSVIALAGIVLFMRKRYTAEKN